MKKNNDIEKQLNDLNQSLSIPYSKSREEIWETLSKETVEKEPLTKPVRLMRRRLLRLAAMIVLVVGSGVILRYYHYTVVSAPGEMSAFYLPDGSEITLAAGSEASYYPLWWSVSRIVTLKGEAFFKVQKGEKFSVRSERGITSVLGTSFDIYARNDNYRVVCYTGKVNVEARKSNKQIVLTPGEKAEIDLAGDISFSKENKTGRYIAWLDNQFVFTSAPCNLYWMRLAEGMMFLLLLKSLLQDFIPETFPPLYLLNRPFPLFASLLALPL